MSACSRPCAGTSHCASKASDGLSFINNDKFKFAMKIGMDILKKVTLVSLACFAFYKSWELFVPAFFVGFAVGVLTKSEFFAKACKSAASCSSGLMEQLTGIKLPDWALLLINTAVLFAHLDHHKNVFAPMIGLYTGIVAGREAANSAKELWQASKEIYRDAQGLRTASAT